MKKTGQEIKIDFSAPKRAELSFARTATGDEFLNILSERNVVFNLHNENGEKLGGTWCAAGHNWEKWGCLLLYNEAWNWMLKWTNSAWTFRRAEDNTYYIKVDGDQVRYLKNPDFGFYWTIRHAGGPWFTFETQNQPGKYMNRVKGGGSAMDAKLTGSPLKFRFWITNPGSMTDAEKSFFKEFTGDTVNYNFAECGDSIEKAGCVGCRDPQTLISNANCQSGFKNSCSAEKILNDPDCNAICLQSTSYPEINDLCDAALKKSVINPCNGFGNDTNTYGGVCSTIYSKNNMDRNVVKGFWENYCRNNSNDVNCTCINQTLMDQAYLKYRDNIFDQAKRFIEEKYNAEINNATDDELKTKLQNAKQKALNQAMSNASAGITARSIQPADSVCFIQDCMDRNYPVINYCTKTNLNTQIAICENTVNFSAKDEANVNNNRFEQSCNINQTIQNIKNEPSSPSQPEVQNNRPRPQPQPDSQTEDICDTCDCEDEECQECERCMEDETEKEEKPDNKKYFLIGGIVLVVVVIIIILALLLLI